MSSILPIFPGAQGFGAYTVAGRGKPIRHVTTLNDSGAGSLRQALIDSSGGAGGQIVFDVSGVIRLQSQLISQASFLSVYGQSAPSGGIVLTDYGMTIRGNDILIQHITVCMGDRSIGAGADSGRCFNIEANAIFNTFNVVLDHCSAHWGTDDVMTIIQGGGGSVHDVTVQYSLVNQGLYDSLHSTGPHSRGLNVAAASDGNISVHHNIISNCDQRGPNLASLGNQEAVCNWMVNWQKNSLELKNIGPAHVIGNLFTVGPDWGQGVNPPVPEYRSRPIHVEGTLWTAYLLGNALWIDGVLVEPDVQTELVEQSHDLIKPDFLFEPNGITIHPTSLLRSRLLRSAGSRPLHRTTLDRAIIQQITPAIPRSGMIDSQTQMGGYPVVAPVTRAYVEPSTPLADSDGDGYTDLEEDMFRMHVAVSGLNLGSHTS